MPTVTGVCMSKGDLVRLLELALELMSQYAKELNQIDGGDRKEYDDIAEWKADASN